MSNIQKADFLFDSTGKHIANWVDEQLYSPSGEHIGHYLSDYEIFIDIKGNYLGEIVFDERLMYNISSPYKYQNFGALGDFGNVGNLGDPGNFGYLDIEGYIEVKAYWL